MLLFLMCCLTIESIIDAASSSSSSSSSSSFAPSSSLSNTRPVGWRSGTLTQRQRRCASDVAITVLLRGGDATIDVDSNDDDEENEDEVTVDIENEPSSTASSSSSSVVKIRISTSLQSSIVDHTTSLMSSGKRTILSLRQAMARSLPGNPPLSIVKLRHCGRLLDDDSMTVEDVLQLARDDDDDDDDDDTIDDNDEDDENIEKLVFTCDILPPIDTKFGLQLKESTSTLSTREILHAYYLNVAGLSYLQEQQQQQQQQQHQSQEENTDSNTLNLLRKKATLVQKQFETNFSNEIFNQITYEHERVLNSRRKKSGIDNYTTTEDDDDDDVFGLIPRDTSGSSSSTTRRKNSKKHAGVGGGATTNVKRILQKNMNIQWSTTIRNSILFLFFGYFGGRNSFSQTLLLLLSPLCFVIQTRPIKLFLKQLFYTMGEPPGIILSLLPAPQQAIMSCDYSAVMKKLYASDGMNDNDVLENEEWLLMEREEIDDMKMYGASQWGSTGSSKGGANLEDEVYDDDDDYDDDN